MGLVLMAGGGASRTTRVHPVSETTNKRLGITFESYKDVTVFILCIFHQVTGKNGPSGGASHALDFSWSTSTSG